MSQMMKVVNFLKEDPSAAQKLVENKISMVGLSEDEQKAVKDVFRQGVPGSNSTLGYW